MILQIIFFAGLGLIVGSFLNVLVLRFGTGRGLMGRSACMSCNNQLSWHELIPFFSWIAARGRCRTCGTRVSIQYPLVELSTAVLFVIVGFAGLPLHFLFLSLIIVCTLIAIAVYDMHHTIIPDAWAYVFAMCAMLYGAAMVVSGGVHPSDVLWLIFSGPIVAAPLFLLWLISRGAWMGLGDAKLSLGIGFLLGVSNGLFAVLFSFVIGAIVTVGIVIPISRITSFGRGGGQFTMKSEIPFGPFLIASCITVWLSHLYGINLLSALLY